MREEKHFDEWNEVKKHRHNSGRVPVIKDGEIWWCAMGENIEVEINDSMCRLFFRVRRRLLPLRKRV